MRTALRLSFHLMVGLMVLGALAGIALSLGHFDGSYIQWDDNVIEGPTSLLICAAVGGLVGVCLAVCIAIVAALVGVIVPLFVALVVCAVVIALIVALASVLGSVAVAFSPVLLLGLGCVLLIRAIGRKSVNRPQSLPPI